MKCTVEVHNMPAYATDMKYLVVRLVDHQLWFYGAFDNEEKANTTAENLGDEALVVTRL